MNKSAANLAALQAINAECETPIKILQNRYFNDLVEQEHRSIKRRVRPMLGFYNFRCARIILGGIKTTHTIRKGQTASRKVSNPSAAEQFYTLVA